jgi:hypothetical protein
MKVRTLRVFQVLHDPEKRQIYDVYGKKGLEAGLEVGEKYKGVEELRQQWEAFQQKAREMRVATEIAPSTHIKAKVNAAQLVESVNMSSGSCVIPLMPWVFYEPIWPVIEAVQFQHSLNFNLSNQCHLTVGGLLSSV